MALTASSQSDIFSPQFLDNPVVVSGELDRRNFLMSASSFYYKFMYKFRCAINYCVDMSTRR